MDAPSQTPERSRELADLRRRAYGPDADIQRDPNALGRLHELEELVRSEAGAAAAPADEEPPEPEPPRPVPPTAASGGQPPTATVVETTEPTPDPVPSASDRPWWRRGIVWGIVGVSLLCGIALGAWGYSMTLPKPDFTLELEPGAGERDSGWNSVLSAWGLDPGSAVPYEGYNGLDVWTVISDTGARCVLVTRQSDPISVSCAAQDLDPTLDLTVYPGLGAYFETPPPDGTVIRLVARSGGIDVWVRTPGVSLSQALDTSWRDSAPSAP